MKHYFTHGTNTNAGGELGGLGTPHPSLFSVPSPPIKLYHDSHDITLIETEGTQVCINDQCLLNQQQQIFNNIYIYVDASSSNRTTTTTHRDDHNKLRMHNTHYTYTRVRRFVTVLTACTPFSMHYGEGVE